MKSAGTGRLNAFASNMRFEDAYTARLMVATRPLFEMRGQRLLRLKRGGPDAAAGAKEGLDVALQRGVGDFIVMDDATSHYLLTVDLKVERRASRNLFLETQSNAVLDPDRHRPGWGSTLRADSLWYAFEDADAVAVVRLPALRGWLNEMVPDGRGQRLRYMAYREVAQSAHKQLNVTVGRLVPFSDMPAEVFPRCMLLDGDTACFAEPGRFVERVDAARTMNRPAA